MRADVVAGHTTVECVASSLLPSPTDVAPPPPTEQPHDLTITKLKLPTVR